MRKLCHVWQKSDDRTGVSELGDGYFIEVQWDDDGSHSLYERADEFTFERVERASREESRSRP